MNQHEVKRPRPLDFIAEELQRLRVSAGSPSYGELASRIAGIRQGRGASEHEARVGRTTVYDAFREGRTRIDPDLVADIVSALGEGEDAGAWRDRCVQALRGTHLPERDAEDDAPETEARRVPRLARAWFLAACVVLNCVGMLVANVLGAPIHLDMIGTASGALLLGPWHGVLVAVLTHGIGAMTTPSFIAFVPVNVAGALLWGYGARRGRLASSVPRLVGLNLLVALGCSAVAVPIVYALGARTGHASDTLVQSLLDLGGGLVVAVVVGNVLTSLVDKLVAGFIALAVIESVPVGLRAHLPPSWMTRRPHG